MYLLLGDSGGMMKYFVLLLLCHGFVNSSDVSVDDVLSDENSAGDTDKNVELSESDEAGSDKLPGSYSNFTIGVFNASISNTSTSNSTVVSRKAICEMVENDKPVADVEIINASTLLRMLQTNPNITNRGSAAQCHIVYFFSAFCPFSVLGSPYINALARSLKNIPVFGVDSIENHSINSRYGVVGTPSLLLFHNGIVVSRYNASEYSTSHLMEFINYYSDQKIDYINVTSSDFKCRLPTKVEQSVPYALWAAWTFIFCFIAWLFLKSDLCARVSEAILNSWREAEAHAHQD